MSFQLACRGGCKVTLTAFVCLFSTVDFKCPRILPLSYCEFVKCALKLLARKVTIPHWLQLFDLSPQCIVFNMYPQMDSPRVCNIATIIAFVKTFPTLCFDMSPIITYLSRYIIALVAFV